MGHRLVCGLHPILGNAQVIQSTHLGFVLLLMKINHHPGSKATKKPLFRARKKNAAGSLCRGTGVQNPGNIRNLPALHASTTDTATSYAALHHLQQKLTNEEDGVSSNQRMGILKARGHGSHVPIHHCSVPVTKYMKFQ